MGRTRVVCDVSCKVDQFGKKPCVRSGDVPCKYRASADNVTATYTVMQTSDVKKRLSWLDSQYKKNSQAQGDPTSLPTEQVALTQEQIEWAVQEEADYIIGETFDSFGEALLALEAIKQYGHGCPAVITVVPYVPDYTTDGVAFPEACRQLEEAGAAVVGLNCGRGPATMMPLIKEIRKVCKGPIAAVPVTFRTKAHQKTFQTLTDPETGKPAYPLDLDSVKCTRDEIRQFAKEVKAAGVQYVGLCCGNAPYLMREVAEVFGRNPPASKFSPDLSFSYVTGELAKEYPAAAKTRAHMLGL